jgi:hypothetical protein
LATKNGLFKAWPNSRHLYSFSRFLPIIYYIRKAKITGSYHKILGLTKSGVGCEGDRNYFVVMILSIVQDIWVGVRWVALEI